MCDKKVPVSTAMINQRGFMGQLHSLTCVHAHSHIPLAHTHTHTHIQLSLSASSPALSDRSIFPKFFRTIPSEIQSNSARFALMDKYSWRRVATLHQTETIFTLVSIAMYY